jgi:hypothetical protein
MGTTYRKRKLMAMKTRPHLGSSASTEAQLRLLGRHRRGILKLADLLTAKSGVRSDALMFVLAAQRSNVASVIREVFPGALPAKESVVIPGLATELPKWIERLALSGPLVDCVTVDRGILVIVIDDANAMALSRIAP